MNYLQTLNIDKPIKYDGTQLRPHWIYETTQLRSDSLVAFQGEANVPIEHMVDLEDVRDNAPIYSPLMLHFIGEWFIDSLDIAILYQRLFIQNCVELLRDQGASELRRSGDDIFYKERKLSVSIATKSPVSILMHTGLNIRTEGTPVPTAGLAEMDVSPKLFANQALDKFADELTQIKLARSKVIAR